MFVTCNHGNYHLYYECHTCSTHCRGGEEYCFWPILFLSTIVDTMDPSSLIVPVVPTPCFEPVQQL